MRAINNDDMVVPGKVVGGVVVLEGSAKLPEGAAVTVSYEDTSQKPPAGKKRIQVPLVRTGQPGTVNLTGERVAEVSIPAASLDFGSLSFPFRTQRLGIFDRIRSLLLSTLKEYAT